MSLSLLSIPSPDSTVTLRISRCMSAVVPSTMLLLTILPWWRFLRNTQYLSSSSLIALLFAAYHNVDLHDLPTAFYRVLIYLAKQRAYENNPSESLSIDLRQHHASAYQCLTSLSYIEQYDLSQFRAFLTVFPASYPWDDTILYVDMSLLPLYQLPLQPVEGAPSHSASQRIITRAERRLMATKNLQSPPYTWRGTKSQRSTEHDDMSSILIDSPMETANTRQENKPALAKPLNAYAAEWNPPRSSLNTSFDSPKTSHHLLPTTNTKNKSKTRLNQASLNDDFLRSRSSLALPVLHITHQRNGGYTFFSDGNDHECFPDTVEQGCPPLLSTG